MTRRSEASGATVREAVAAAIADLVGCETEKVELEIRAPGLEDLEGSIRVRVDLEPATPQPEGEDGEAEVLETEPVDGEDADAEAADAAGVAEVDEDEDERPGAELTAEDLDEEADAAADFLEGLLDAMDLPGDLRLRVHDDHAEIEVVDIGSGALIGRRGQTLEAIQELLRCALQREFQRRARVKVDAEGYRARRLEKLLEKAEEAIDEVLDTGEPQRLEPMDVFERKAVHHLVAEVDGLSSRSQGREPARRVIIERE